MSKTYNASLEGHVVRMHGHLELLHVLLELHFCGFDRRCALRVGRKVHWRPDLLASHIHCRRTHVVVTLTKYVDGAT